jgi:hypothetical protein
MSAMLTLTENPNCRSASTRLQLDHNGMDERERNFVRKGYVTWRFAQDHTAETPESLLEVDDMAIRGRQSCFSGSVVVIFGPVRVLIVKRTISRGRRVRNGWFDVAR